MNPASPDVLGFTWLRDYVAGWTVAERIILAHALTGRKNSSREMDAISSRDGK
jgi:hypothetical protein